MSKKGMKVLFIARKFPPSVGGMERFAFDLSNALDDEAALKKITWGGSNKWLPLVLPVFFLRACWALLMDRNISIIHMQDAVQAPVGWLLGAIFRKPYVIVAHGLDITYEMSIYQKVIIPFVRRADAVISISTATNEEVERRGPVRGELKVITPGMHKPEDVPSNKDALAELIGIDVSKSKILLTTGRLVKRKGVAWFIEHALPSIVKKHPDVKYLVVGEGEHRQAIEDAIKASGMKDYVELLGRVSDEARSLLYGSSDVFVMPNIVVPGDMEGFGLVVQEAACAGMPVVASGIEGIKDAIHHKKNGVLVATRDTTQFVEEISKLLRDESARQKFGESAREYTLREFNWNKIAKRYAEVYEKITKV